MTLQTDLRDVTDRIIAARQELAHADVYRNVCKHAAVAAADELDIARRAVMSRSDAGSNDAARRAYADRETATERNLAEFTADGLFNAETDIVRATAALRQAEDERRYLELVSQLAIAGISDPAPAPAPPVKVYANGNGEVIFPR